MENLESIYTTTEQSMQKCIDSLKKDFTTLRSGRVSINILDNVKVDYYGTPTPLNQVANIIATDASTISISPWEKQLVKDISKAILEANIGVTPNNDSDTIKLFFPPMTSEQRVIIAKEAKAMGEKAKNAIRNVRQNSNKQIQKMEKDKEITEDLSKKGLDTIQKHTDNYVKRVEELVKAKEEEVLKV